MRRKELHLAKVKRMKLLATIASLLLTCLVAVLTVLGQEKVSSKSEKNLSVTSTSSLNKKLLVESASSQKESTSVPVPVSVSESEVDMADVTMSDDTNTLVTSTEATQSASVTQATDIAPVYVEQVAYSNSAEQSVTPQTTVAYSQASAPVQQTGYVLSNGNTAGTVGSQAAAQMAAATGVPQSTWEYIIARESNGNATASNASGASGLFQTMPGWGSTATVQDQVNAALNAYNAQGLSAWGM
ncbi:cytoskeletal protein RodZ [Streptococcus porcorum]|uniref:Cytoskeletal protein RodZ n=1 Tax=Streptococcus porcorum TaxID=701526 RepID=A0ABV2JCK3_9STRE